MAEWKHWMELMEPGELVLIAHQTGASEDALNAAMWERIADMNGGPAYKADVPGYIVTIWFDNEGLAGIVGNQNPAGKGGADERPTSR